MLITTGDTVSAVVYEDGEGWTVVGKTAADSPKEAVVNDVIEYRGYGVDDKERVLTFVRELYTAMDELGDE